MAKKKKKEQEQKQVLVNKQELISKRAELYKNILQRTNKTLYQNYLDLKEIIEINKKLYNETRDYEIAERLGCDPSYIKYLLRFDKLKDLSWLDKIPANVILLTINFNDDSEERQEEHFETFEDKKYNVDKARIHLVKEYVEKQNWDSEQLPHVLYSKIVKQVETLSNFLSWVKRSTMKKEEKDLLKEHIINLNKKAEEILK